MIMAFLKNINNIDVEFNKQGWHTHTMSWTNTNVINSLNGKVIIKNDLINDTYEVLRLQLSFILSNPGQI